MEKKTYSYYGNTVTKDGKIFNAKGKELIISARGTVMIRVDGKKHIYKNKSGCLRPFPRTSALAFHCHSIIISA